MVYHILLFYFSRKDGSYFIDTDGHKWFCRISSNQLLELECKDWFVKINKNTYLNMWYFERDTSFNYAIVMDPYLASAWNPIQIQMVEQLTVVSVRCRVYFRDHFERRDQLSTSGWGQYIRYVTA